jgi:NAD-dependent deacetylase
MQKIDLKAYRRIIVLTGAGISEASGLRTYRGKNGLWGEVPVEEFSSLAGFQAKPLDVWRFHSDMRRAVQAAAPNAAHLALAQAEQRLTAGSTLTVITQNIDGLHQRAGSKAVLELHGNVCRTKCSNNSCSFAEFAELIAHDEAVPNCPQCGAALRPAVTWFGEALPVDASWQAKRLLRDCDLFLAIGTSGTVSPAADFVRGAEYAGARTVLVNLEPMQPPNPYFKEQVLGPATEILPRLLGLA